MEPYQIIYADPPWRYDQKGLQGAAEKHYSTMSLEDICKLPVGSISAKDSILFLWATFPQLPAALRVISAWGFKYKTVAFLWLKKNRKADSWFFGRAFGQEETRRCACWQRGDTRSGNPAKFTNSSFLPLRPTAKSRILSVTKLWSWPGMSPESSCLPARQHPDGMYGEMK